MADNAPLAAPPRAPLDVEISRQEELGVIFEKLEALCPDVKMFTAANLASVYKQTAERLQEAVAASSPDWQPMESAPIEGRFLVTDGSRMMVMDGHIYSLSILPGTPHHLSGHHWTLWMPLPALPRLPQEPTPEHER